MGILDDAVCETILNKAQEHYKRMKLGAESYPIPQLSDIPEPSAPPKSDSFEDESPTAPGNLDEELIAPSRSPGEEPSAPPISPEAETKLWCQTECVICFDSQVCEFGFYIL